MSRRFTAYFLCLLLASSLLAGCVKNQTATNQSNASQPETAQAVPQASPTQNAPRPSGPIEFTDVTAQAGIRFKHNSGAAGKKYLPETLGSGCAFLDYDSDGWQDVLLVNSSNKKSTRL